MGGDVLIICFAVIVAFINLSYSLSAVPQFAQTREAAMVFLNVINREPEIDSQSTEGIQPSVNNGLVQLHNVSYKYHIDTDRYILHNIHMEFPVGKTIGIVGPSGSGKSTLIKLLLRFYDPIEGEVLYDNTNIKNLNIHWLREQMGYVSQEPVLFSGTIRENLLLGKTDGEATEEEIIEACKKAGAHDFIKKFPMQYDTYVGELGSSLSGGQKQRIAIARALLRKPKILIFDEATSALDSKSEERIQEAIENIRKEKDMCIIIIAHRLSSVQNSDIIYVVKDGELVEQGNHHQLLEKKGLYSELWGSINAESKEVVVPTETRMESEREKSERVSNKEEQKEKDIEAFGKQENLSYSTKRLMSYMTPKKCLYYFGFIFVVLKGFVWPLYSIGITYLEKMLYSYGMHSFCVIMNRTNKLLENGSVLWINSLLRKCMECGLLLVVLVDSWHLW